jgi:ABC-2 type transport system ATP-binding protein
MVDGTVPWKDRKQYAEKIGVVFGQRSQLWWDLPISDTYNLFRHMYKIPGAEYNSRIDQLKKLLDLNEFWDRPVRQLSLGQRMRGELGAALLHKPKLLFLDEPTIGMDVIVKEAIRNFIKDINKEYGTTILLTTHDLDEVERTCSRVIVINKGMQIYDGTMEALKSRCKAESILSVEFDTNIDNEAFAGLKVVQKGGNKASFAFLRREKGAGQVLDKLSDLNIRDIVIQEPPIEDVIREFYI